MKMRSEHELVETGIEWLGNIPRYWSTARVADHVTLVAGHPFSSDGFNPTVGMPLVRESETYTVRIPKSAFPEIT